MTGNNVSITTSPRRLSHDTLSRPRRNLQGRSGAPSAASELPLDLGASMPHHLYVQVVGALMTAVRAVSALKIEGFCES
jgi:hypothetical protein